MIDPAPLWDFDDPVASEARLRSAAEAAESDDRAVLLTQVARALGLQEGYDEGHAVLDALVAPGAASPEGAPEVAVRIALERGRLLRSAGNPDDARPHFDGAAALAHEAGLDALHVDALHMVALVAAPDEQVSLGERALTVARASSQPAARAWESSLLNNIGMAHADAERWSDALGSFEAALIALPDDDVARTRVARWMVGWALRNLGRGPEALALQRELRADLASTGDEDPYVEEEIALLEADPTAT